MQRRIRPFSAMGTAIAAVAIVLSACTPIDPGPPTSSTSTTTTAPDGGNPPSISSFAASTTTGPSPLTTVFTWSISDPDPGPLSCGLDLDDDGTFEVGISNCTSSTIRSATFTSVGANPVRLRVDDGTTTVTSAPLPISVGASATDQFAITVRSDGTLTAPQLAAFDAAAARWSQVIRTGLPDVAINAPANLCGTDAPAFAGTVDDVLIDASIVAIDGPGGTLGLAGPCLTRSGGGLPALGAMQFDSADVAALQASGQLQAVILHEMGHVLGIGTLWGSLLSGAGTAATSFTGLTARGSWNAIIGGSTPVGPGREHRRPRHRGFALAGVGVRQRAHDRLPELRIEPAERSDHRVARRSRLRRRSGSGGPVRHRCPACTRCAIGAPAHRPAATRRHRRLILHRLAALAELSATGSPRPSPPTRRNGRDPVRSVRR